MPNSKRYFSDFNDELGVTPSQLKRLSKAKQREYLLHWFGMHYEDPANETPYNSQEGGYQYVWGGPYDALEEVEQEFGTFISDSVIESVVKEVESDGLTDWAPGRHHSDHQRAADEYYDKNREENLADADIVSNTDTLENVIKQLEKGVKPHYGDAIEIEYRRVITGDVNKILQALPPRPLAGIGHNNPPLDDESTAQDFVTEIRDAAEIICLEVAKPSPSAVEAARAASRLDVVAGWIGKKT